MTKIINFHESLEKNQNSFHLMLKEETNVKFYDGGKNDFSQMVFKIASWFRQSTGEKP